MATIKAQANGVWSEIATWSGGVIPGPGDIAVANGFTVTVDTNVTCMEARNDTTDGATAGGRFALNNGITLTANVYAGGTANSNGCVSASTAGPSRIVGDVYAGTGCIGARNGGVQTLTIIGTVYGNGYGPGSTGITAGIYGAVNASTGLLYVKTTVQGPLGMPAVSGPMQFIDTAHAFQKVRATSGYTEITLRHPDAVVPHTSDVLGGTTYAAGAYVGTATGAATQDMSSTFAMTGANPLAGLYLLDETGAVLTDDLGYPLLGED